MDKVRIFLRELFEHGKVTVPALDQDFEPAIECETELRAFDRSARLELPAGLPEFDLLTAIWAADRLAEISRLIVARSAGTDEFAAAFSVPCPSANSAGVDYTADLFLRHLPALSKFTETLSPGDPLIGEITKLAAAWPLSSVGMKLAEPPKANRVELFLANPALVRVYADRILAAVDI